MKYLGKVSGGNARVFETMFSRFRIFVSTLCCAKQQPCIVIMRGGLLGDERISLYLWWYLRLFRGYAVEHWGVGDVLVKYLK